LADGEGRAFASRQRGGAAAEIDPQSRNVAQLHIPTGRFMRFATNLTAARAADAGILARPAGFVLEASSVSGAVGS
jgi:hypothetical protein